MFFAVFFGVLSIALFDELYGDLCDICATYDELSADRYAVSCVIMICRSDVSGTAAVARYMTPRDLLERAGAARSMCARDILYCVFSRTASARANNTALVFASPTVLPHEPTSTSSDA